MNIVNFGSLNNDFVYKVKHFVQPGETIISDGMEVFPGGKGLNQSVAVARAGGRVCHAGYYGKGGEPLRDLLAGEDVDCSCLEKCDAYQGQASIQVNEEGQNCIVVYGGSNHRMDEAFVDRVLSRFPKGSIVLLQNEVSCVEYIIRKAAGLGMRVVFNPSPMNEAINRVDLSLTAWLLLNEVEGGQITGKQDYEEILDELRRRHPVTGIVLTLGSEGVLCTHDGRVIRHHAYRVPAVDTTAAGDTFTGYFIAGLAEGGEALENIIRKASMAASICVSRAGASPSIPCMKEVLDAFEG